MDLYSFLRTFTDLRRLMFSFLCKYEDNRFILRQLSKSFYNLPLFETLSIDRQSKAFLTRFFRTNQIRKLIICNHNPNLFRIPRETFQHVRKIVIKSLDAKELYLLCKLFSRFHITNLKIKYCTCPLPTSLLSFSSLERLDICITSRENQNTVFSFLHLNRTTLKKLKIGIYTGKGVDESKVQEIIEQDLQLEYIGIRGDLFTYDMIRPFTNHITQIIPYIESKTHMLRYVVQLRLEGVANDHLSTIFKSLVMVERLSLYGNLENFDHVSSITNHVEEFILRDYDERDLSVSYNGTIANIDIVQSKGLTFLFMKGFTIGNFPDFPLKEIMIEDVCFTKPIFLSVLHNLYIENEVMNPTRFTLAIFRLPRLKEISLIHVLVKDMFVYHQLRFINIQHSIISIDMEHMMKKHKRYLKSVLFYMNRWSFEGFDKEKLLKLTRTLRIDAREPEDW